MLAELERRDWLKKKMCAATGLDWIDLWTGWLFSIKFGCAFGCPLGGLPLCHWHREVSETPQLRDPLRGWRCQRSALKRLQHWRCFLITNCRGFGGWNWALRNSETLWEVLHVGRWDDISMSFGGHPDQLQIKTSCMAIESKCKREKTWPSFRHTRKMASSPTFWSNNSPPPSSVALPLIHSKCGTAQEWLKNVEERCCQNHDAVAVASYEGSDGSVLEFDHSFAK